jgi:hypothetical protein
LGIGTIWAGAFKQSIVAKSAGEAELISASDNGSILLKARNFLISQGYDIGSAVYGLDNTSAMQLLVKGKSTSRKTAHIAIRYYWLCDRIKSKELIVKHVKTLDMLADLLTKPLCGIQFRKLRAFVLGHMPADSVFSAFAQNSSVGGETLEMVGGRESILCCGSWIEEVCGGSVSICRTPLESYKKI